MTWDQNRDWVVSNRCSRLRGLHSVSDLYGDVFVGGRCASWDVEQCLPYFDLEIRAAQVKAERVDLSLEAEPVSGRERCGAMSGAVDL